MPFGALNTLEMSGLPIEALIPCTLTSPSMPALRKLNVGVYGSISAEVMDLLNMLADQSPVLEELVLLMNLSSRDEMLPASPFARMLQLRSLELHGVQGSFLSSEEAMESFALAVKQLRNLAVVPWTQSYLRPMGITIRTIQILTYHCTSLRSLHIDLNACYFNLDDPLPTPLQSLGNFELNALYRLLSDTKAIARYLAHLFPNAEVERIGVAMCRFEGSEHALPKCEDEIGEHWRWDYDRGEMRRQDDTELKELIVRYRQGLGDNEASACYS